MLANVVAWMGLICSIGLFGYFIGQAVLIVRLSRQVDHMLRRLAPSKGADSKP